MCVCVRERERERERELINVYLKKKNSFEVDFLVIPHNIHVSMKPFIHTIIWNYICTYEPNNKMFFRLFLGLSLNTRYRVHFLESIYFPNNKFIF